MSNTYTDINMTISINNELDKDKNYTLNVRKFFFMLFPKADGRTLHIYTALVFSLYESSHVSNPDDIHRESNSFVELKIGFEDIVSVEFNDLTDSFINQRHLLPQIWKDLMDERNSEGKGYVAFRDNDKEFVVSSGTFVSAASKKYYTVSTTDIKKGVITWVKSTVELTTSYIDRSFRIRVKLGDGASNIRVICPDYMWYTCTPPELYHEASNGLISFDNGNTILYNQVAGLSKDTPLMLTEWVEDEDILSCKRARLQFEGKKDPKFEDKKDVLVILKIQELFEEHTNRQFFTGLVIAFFSAFVADYTRISSMLQWQYGTVSVIKIHLLSILFPISIIFSYIAYVIPISRIVDMLLVKIDRKILAKIITIIKVAGIFFSLMGPVFFYVVYPIIRAFNNRIPLPFKVYYSTIGGCVLSGIYSFYFAIRAHIKFYNYL